MRTKGAKGIKNIDGIGQLLNELDFMFIGFSEKQTVKLMLRKAYNIGRAIEVKKQIEYERQQRVEMALKRIMDKKYLPQN
jgi:hypothetical protein